jgi:RNA polymerase sigma-70 factor (ECF subfamily)
LRIATNSGLNYIRDNKNSDSLDEALEENPQMEPASKQNVELEVERTFTQALLNEAIGELSPRHRHFFILRYQHDLSYEDISVATGESISTLKALLFRIRERLKKILTEKMREPVN